MFRAILDGHRARLASMISQRNIAPVRKVYNAAQADLEARLRNLGRSTDSFTAVQLRMALAQVRQGQLMMARNLLTKLEDLTRTAQQVSLKGLTKDLTQLERHYTGVELQLPIAEASRFKSIINNRSSSLLAQHQASVARLTTAVVQKVEDKLTVAVLTQQDLGSVIDDVAETTGDEVWQAERIARTEILGAYNGAAADGMRDTADVLEDMRMRWVERVDDATYQPLDDRVDVDSIAMHGQVAQVGGGFGVPNTMPDGSPIPLRVQRFRGQTFAYPPMRPQDRASIAPWRPGWGIPGWELVGGRRNTLV